MVFKELYINDSEVWDSFIETHPNGNIFQSSNYFKLHLEMPNLSPFAFGIFQGSTLVGSVLGVIQSNSFFPINIFTKRAIIIGGPLILNNDISILDYLLTELTRKLKKKSIYIQFRNLWDFGDNKEVFLKHGFIFEAHLDIINDLVISEENIIQKISKNKRGNVNKSRNQGTKFLEITEINEFDKAIDLVNKTYKNIGLPCPSKNYFMKAFISLFPTGILKTFVAKYDEEIIGVRLELCYGNMIYDWYAGANKIFNNKYPNDFLLYNILMWGKENNYQKFDFGGAGKPNIPYGVRDYKLKFGGELVEFGRFEKIHKRVLFQIGKLGFELYKRIK